MNDIKMKIELGSKGVECIHEASGILVGVLLKKSKTGEIVHRQQSHILRNFSNIYAHNYVSKSHKRFIVESPAGYEQELNDYYDGPNHIFLFNQKAYNDIKSKGGEVIDVQLFDSRGL